MTPNVIMIALDGSVVTDGEKYDRKRETERRRDREIERVTKEETER